MGKLEIGFAAGVFFNGLESNGFIFSLFLNHDPSIDYYFRSW